MDKTVRPLRRKHEGVSHALPHESEANLLDLRKRSFNYGLER
jgi:hypothetical protein